MSNKGRLTLPRLLGLEGIPAAGLRWNLASLALLTKQASFSGLHGAQYDKLINRLGVIQFLTPVVDDSWLKYGIPNWLDPPGATLTIHYPLCVGFEAQYCQYGT